MCLITKMTEPIIAEKDITCYKIIRKDMSSYFYPIFKWEIGKIYTSWLGVLEDIGNSNSNVIHQAFHSYATLEALKMVYYKSIVPCLTVKCTIRKGSRVYKGRHDYIQGYASDQLIVNEVIGVKELYPDFDWDHYPYKEGQVIKYKKSHYEIWEDYQIMNIQPHPLNNICVDLIVKNCDDSNINTTVETIFNGKIWRSENCFIR